ncbi:hypothetical protein ACP4OV_014776 [Aristida adscensionis]
MDPIISNHAFNNTQLRRNNFFQSTSTRGITAQFYGVGPFGELLAYGNDRGNTMVWPVAPPGSWQFTLMGWQVTTGWSNNRGVPSAQFTGPTLPQWNNGTGAFIPNSVPMEGHVPNFTPEVPIRDRNATFSCNKSCLNVDAGEACTNKGKEKKPEESTSTTTDDLAEQIARLPEEWIYERPSNGMIGCDVIQL